LTAVGGVTGGAYSGDLRNRMTVSGGEGETGRASGGDGGNGGHATSTSSSTARACRGPGC
jgi:hypothetical protein